jgi:hypothetical protein
MQEHIDKKLKGADTEGSSISSQAWQDKKS